MILTLSVTYTLGLPPISVKENEERNSRLAALQMPGNFMPSDEVFSFPSCILDMVYGNIYQQADFPGIIWHN